MALTVKLESGGCKLLNSDVFLSALEIIGGPEVKNSQFATPLRNLQVATKNFAHCNTRSKYDK